MMTKKNKQTVGTLTGMGLSPVLTLLAVAVFFPIRAVAQEPPSDSRRQIIEAMDRKDAVAVCNLATAHPELFDAKAENGWTPLHCAAGVGNRDLAELLLTIGADVNAKDKGGVTPLHVAVYNRHRDVTELLLAKGAKVNTKANDGATPLHDAAAVGTRDLAELLLTKGADVNAKDKGGMTPLSIAIRFHHEDVASLLRAHGTKD